LLGGQALLAPNQKQKQLPTYHQRNRNSSKPIIRETETAPNLSSEKQKQFPTYQQRNRNLSEKQTKSVEERRLARSMQLIPIEVVSF